MQKYVAIGSSWQLLSRERMIQQMIQQKGGFAGSFAESVLVVATAALLPSQAHSSNADD
jgi:hypothetical protein